MVHVLGIFEKLPAASACIALGSALSPVPIIKRARHHDDVFIRRVPVRRDARSRQRNFPRIVNEPGLVGVAIQDGHCAPGGREGGAGPHFTWSGMTILWLLAAAAGFGFAGAGG